MKSNIPRVIDIIPSNGGSNAAETVVLDYDDRFRRRIVLRAESGVEFLLEMAEPRLLLDGDLLQLDNGTVVAVKAAPERLAEITCDTPHALVRVAWHLGNRHLPTQLLEGGLRIRADHVIIDMVEKLGAKVSLIEAPFQPEGGAYGHGQVHSHDHHHGQHTHHQADAENATKCGAAS